MNFIKKYINQVIVELKKVSWPSRQQTINKTVLVVIVSITVAAYIGGLDYILQALMRSLIN
jgi:preprotein translocase subunit SecE